MHIGWKIPAWPCINAGARYESLQKDNTFKVTETQTLEHNLIDVSLSHSATFNANLFEFSERGCSSEGVELPVILK